MIDRQIEEAISENEEILHHMEMDGQGNQSENFQLHGETDLTESSQEE